MWIIYQFQFDKWNSDKKKILKYCPMTFNNIKKYVALRQNKQYNITIYKDKKL